MTVEREQEIHSEIWRLMAELRELHTVRTGHSFWTHRRANDTAFRCFDGCDAVPSARAMEQLGSSAGS